MQAEVILEEGGPESSIIVVIKVIVSQKWADMQARMIHEGTNTQRDGNYMITGTETSGRIFSPGSTSHNVRLEDWLHG